MGGPLRGAVEAALESASERGALPLLALVSRGGCDFATKVRRVQALNGAVARERREATRLERRRLKRAGKPVPKHLGEGDEDERFAGIVVVDDMANEHASGVAGDLSLMPPGLGDDASVFLPLVMVPRSRRLSTHLSTNNGRTFAARGLNSTQIFSGQTRWGTRLFAGCRRTD